MSIYEANRTRCAECDDSAVAKPIESDNTLVASPVNELQITTATFEVGRRQKANTPKLLVMLSKLFLELVRWAAHWDLGKELARGNHELTARLAVLR